MASGTKTIPSEVEENTNEITWKKYSQLKRTFEIIQNGQENGVVLVGAGSATKDFEFTQWFAKQIGGKITKLVLRNMTLIRSIAPIQFPTLVELELRDCALAMDLIVFRDWCPNLAQLSLIDVKLNGCRHGIVFDSLKVLKVEYAQHIMDHDFLNLMGQTFPAIECFHLKNEMLEFRRAYTNRSIFKNLKELYVSNYSIDSTILMECNIFHDLLEKITIITNRVSLDLIELITDCSKLKVLSLKVEEVDEHVFRIFQKLEQLETVKLDVNTFEVSPGIMIDFLQNVYSFPFPVSYLTFRSNTKNAF